jgi:hypothetical protein
MRRRLAITILLGALAALGLYAARGQRDAA